MVRTATLAAATASLLLSNTVHAEGLYTKNSAVLQITGLDYDRVIAKSNYTSIVEFYAPWCGHCRNLKPAFESAAKSLAGIAKVAAINCDDEMNKPFCGQMGVQGFPTLKIVRPGKKPGKPSVEDYQGQRTAKAIVDTVKDKIPNTVKRITDKNLNEWLAEDNETAKAILFSDKGLTSATLRTLAIDFAGLIPIAQIRNKETEAMKMFGVQKVPTLILLPGGAKDAITYDGEMKKEGMVEFLSQITPPNPDCPPEKVKKPKSKSKKDEKKASASQKSADASSTAASTKGETVEEAVKPVVSPDPEINDDEAPKPVIIPEEETKPKIPLVAELAELQLSCLNAKSKTCILAILPKDESSEAAASALSSLASIHKKHDARAGHLFPFVGVPASNPLASSLVAELKLGNEDEVHLIATNGKRSWWKKYSGQGFGSLEVEQWVDAIRMGEGKKERLPDSLLAEEAKVEVKEEKVADQEPFKIEIEEILDDEETKEPETHHEHGEL
ncbi:thioredoxin-domain-containing protein [Lindgomyces ingoldianus]|uniref:Thioredoxin-domain-containing protein n=1 Tax=Lindgomyces ingoldianus TaxID=673940 RepID=A0ACB6QM95_9PLEO|nr:thioredoxin-domain-containing protein [Lindgomyces ingoldianus]KAF2468031.1 thioredoxin-domain-containing protein [Lindgomyces ingoldianus]